SPEDEALLFVDELEELFAQYVALHWQQRPQSGLRLPGLPQVKQSPNGMYDEGLARWGCIRLPASVNLQYDLLPTAWRTIQHYGIQLNDLFYDGVALNGYRNELSPYNGAHKGQWPIKYDPRDLRSVYFQDPHTDAWSELEWTGARKDQHPFGDVSLRV